jgi:eukaryotic-like serine/threonine-protein kinase
LRTGGAVAGKPPSEFPHERLRVDVGDALAGVGRDLSAVVEGLLEPIIEDRLTAAQALALLRGELVPDSR